MKFGKSLRLVQNLKWNHKWADGYVDYKLLKQLISALEKIEIGSADSIIEVLEEAKKVIGPEFSFNSPSFYEDKDAFGSGGNNNSVEGDTDDIPIILPDLSRIDSIGQEKENEEQYQKENEDDLEMKKINIRSRLLRRSSFSSSVKDIRQKSFMEVLKREFTKVDNLCRKEVRNIEGKLNLVHEKYIQDTTNPNDKGELPSPKEIHQKQGETRKALLNLFRSIERVEAFLNVNSTAIEKIVKKFDKKIKRMEETTPSLAAQVVPYLLKMNKRHKTELNRLRSRLDDLFHQHGRPSKMEEDEAAKQELEEYVVQDEYPTFTDLRLDSFPPESINRFRLVLTYDGLAEPITAPVIVVKGRFEGPVLGITAALHGNELNGIPLIFKLIREIELDALSGTVVAIPVMNAPGFLRHQRGYFDGADLNRLFPGKPNGNCGQVYCHQVMQKVIKYFNYHIDMHTASFGRVNSLYVRADMNNRTTHQMARLQDPQIIVHNTAPDGSLRSAAMKIGIPSITVEIGDPSRIHRRFVKSAFLGVENILYFLKMLDDDFELGEKQPTVCSRSFWMYSQHGGMLHVLPDINTWVEKDQVIARVRNMFGDIVATYVAPCDGIIVGKNVDPVCSTGDRILHLGVVEDNFPVRVDDGHV